MGAEEMLIEAIGVDEVATERAFIDGQRSDDSSFTLGTARLNSLQGREKRLVVVALAFSVVHMQLTQAAFTAVGSCDDADAWLAVASGSARAIG